MRERERERERERREGKGDETGLEVDLRRLGRIFLTYFRILS